MLVTIIFDYIKIIEVSKRRKRKRKGERERERKGEREREKRWKLLEVLKFTNSHKSLINCTVHTTTKLNG